MIMVISDLLLFFGGYETIEDDEGPFRDFREERTKSNLFNFENVDIVDVSCLSYICWKRQMTRSWKLSK